MDTDHERRAERHEEKGELERELLAAAVADPPKDDAAQGPGKERGSKHGEGLDKLRVLLRWGEEGLAWWFELLGRG